MRRPRDGRPRGDGAVRGVRRAVHPRDAGPGVRRARRGLPRGVGRPGVPGRARPAAARLRRAARRCSTRRSRLSERARVPPAAQAGGPQPHRLPQDQQRARPGAAGPADGQAAAWSPRPAPASTAWPPPPPPRCSGSSASSTWARSTWSARRSTSSACACSAPRCGRRRPGSRTLKDAINEAMRDWVATVETSHYLLGSVMGPHPYPWMVRELHRVIGDEAREQCRALLGPRPRRRHRVRRRRLERHRPLLRLRRAARRRAGRRRAGRRRRRRPRRARHRARLEVVPAAGRARAGAWRPSRSRPGLDYPGIGPEHAHLAAIGRARYEKVTDAEVLDAFQAAGPHRGHHPGPRVGPRAGLGAAGQGRAGRARS